MTTKVLGGIRYLEGKTRGVIIYPRIHSEYHSLGFKHPLESLETLRV
jgi:hypothetical protein